MTSKNSKAAWPSTLGVMLVAFLVACTSAPAGTSGPSAANRPTVVVQSPANGEAIAQGVTVAVSGAASDAIGVDHVTLFVDGAAVATTPAGQPATLVPFSFSWLASVAGSHVLQVIAYRADSTASDPVVVNVVVGAGSSLPILSGGSLPPLTFAPPTSGGGVVTPRPSRRPRPSRTPRPPRSAPPPAATPTPDASGNAPDDSNSEIYEINLVPNNTACPRVDTGGPVTASGCIWEQVSAPAGDMLDELEFRQKPETSYRYGLTVCSDSSAIRWSDSDEDVSGGSGCRQFSGKTSSGGNPGSQPIWVGFGPVGAQTYSVYQFTVWECQFEDCASQ